MKNSGKLLLLAITLKAVGVDAQQGVLLNHSAFNHYLLSPAAVGQDGHLWVNCHYKKNWLGIADSPEATQITIDGPLMKNKIGLGINMLNERSGIFSRSFFTAAFRYALQLSKAAKFSFGLSGGLRRHRGDFSRIRAGSPEEFSAWPIQQTVTLPDASLGLLYSYKRLLIGAAAHQIFQRNYVFKEPVFNSELQYKPVSAYVAYIQNTFRISDGTDLITHLAIRSTQGLPAQADLSATVHFRKQFMLTIGCRRKSTFYSGVGFKIAERLRIGYYYDVSPSIYASAAGSHELGVRFDITGQGRHASERATYGNTDELYEKLDQYDERLHTMSAKVDSLDRNLVRLREETDRLRNQQLTSEEITKAIDNYFSSPGRPQANSKAAEAGTPPEVSTRTKYKIIQVDDTREEKYDTIYKGKYHVVYGVYQLLNYAREFQKLLKREAQAETILIEVPGHPKRYLYVCDAWEHTILKPALDHLRAVSNELDRKEIKITKGKPWILQLSTD